MHARAGQPALTEDLIDVGAVLDAYYDLHPDPDNPAQQVSFGTSGHRGSSLDTAFNEDHIAATTQAIVEYRASQGIRGPLFIGRDTHALSRPAFDTAIEVLIGNGVDVLIDALDTYTPTPAISHAILVHNRELSADAPERADGIVVTPSHNPPRDGGFKYNPPHGGPADSDATSWIASRANELLREKLRTVRRTARKQALVSARPYDYIHSYVRDLDSVIDIAAIRSTGISIGADPLGGASVDYWAEIGEMHDLNLTVVNPSVDPQWAFMTLDRDGKIRMDCSSPWAMAKLVDHRHEYDISTGNDADADRHGIVTPDAGLMNPNHYLAVAISYLFEHRPSWPANAKVGKTLVSSALIDRVAASLNRDLHEVPVGFKWFVPGLIDSSVAFGGEESAGASFLRHDGSVWTTDKDGMILALLASEILAVTGKTPSQLHAELVDRFGASSYARIDAPATRDQKARLAALSSDQVTATELAGETITSAVTTASNGAAIGGLKVSTHSAWFAARPSGTEDVYKIYAESFRGDDHLAQVQDAARGVVDSALKD
ncbi:phosphoglucomutase (alpha-D-glucose-1,6-bisphosphate-dependent) [Devriesea agamarum]|uniref:phosphoglucomutase (alpha-D-glucose-1,6-bisphosphate-dependent) n=1 Tax=Devriesea agamarum TaxID=472569 RepID=UPI000B33C203|nr:phosphoglucomutase (alpha-D-glucose-1,6-bisphosphate-dependent) [Devriesea agamarum]